MKINLSDIDLNNFLIQNYNLNNELVYLIQPQRMNCQWTNNNLIFRSSLWNSDGELISAGHKKFFNWGENPDLIPLPKSLKNTHIVTKVDGSLLIVSKYKGNFILRTRGTIDATKLENGFELNSFKEKYLPNLSNLYPEETWEQSFLFEWVSPVNIVVLNYGNNPEWYLVGNINHNDYSLKTQIELDQLANNIGCPRPDYYQFPSIEDLIKNVDSWKGKEGVVVYSNNGQILHKCKSLDYLKKHRFKSNATLENTLELFLQWGYPSYGEFKNKLIETFDYECFEMVIQYVSVVIDAHKQINKIIESWNDFIKNTIKPLKNRKEQAEKILQSYGSTNRSSMLFTLLDNKPLSVDQMKKLFWQILKK